MNIDGFHKNKEFTFNDPKTFNSIGEDAVLENCKIYINVPTKSILIRGKFLNCIFHAKKLINLSWIEASIINCKFEGHYKENEFGNIDSEIEPSKNCDFTDANIDGCQIYGDNHKTNQYPRFPHIVILEPHTNRHDMEAKVYKIKNEELEITVESLEFLDHRATAIVYHAETKSKQTGLSTEELKSFYTDFPFVLL